MKDTEITSLEELATKSKLKIKIHGDDYDGDIDANIATAIVEIQARIYQFAALIRFGSETETRRLSRDVRQALLIQFEIEKGCTELLADLSPVFSEILRPVFVKMTPEQLIDLAKFFASLYCGYKLIASVVNAIKERALGKQRDAHEEKILDQQAKALIEVGRRSSEDVARALPKASGLVFGARKFSQDELSALRERAPKTRVNRNPLRKTYIIEGINLKRRPVIYLELKEVPADTSVKAQYTEDENDAFYDDGTTSALCLAAASGEEVTLDVIETRSEQGDLVRLNVISVVQEKDR